MTLADALSRVRMNCHVKARRCSTASNEDGGKVKEEKKESTAGQKWKVLPRNTKGGKIVFRHVGD